MNFLDERLRAPAKPELFRGPLTEVPADDNPKRRGLRAAPPDTRTYGTLSIAQGQAFMQQAVTTYLADPAPKHMLLIAAPAGLGKTTLAVSTAEAFAAQGAGRVGYIAPRREFFDDTLRPMMQRPNWWYQWQPRTIGMGQGIGQTCRHASQMEHWLKRGYAAKDFCSNWRICGWSYMHTECPFHAQATRTEDIIVMQYEHLVLGNPLLEQCKLIIGDELPLRAFLHPWQIPTPDIVPPAMVDPERETLMRALRALASVPPENGYWSGPSLMTALGGADHVARVCSSVQQADIEAPPLRHPDGAEQAPYAHLIHTLLALGREAEAIQEGQESYIERVRVNGDGLTLLQSRSVEALPPHVIWLDATADPGIYQTLFDRPVELIRPDVQMTGRIYQVWASLNTKSHIGTEADGAPKLEHVRKQAEQIKQRGGYADDKVAIVSYKDLAGVFAEAAQTTHFHGSRGTNRLADCECLIVIGTPQPSATDLVTTAAMVYRNRMEPFNTKWTTHDIAFPGQPWSYPVSGFWDDPQLQLLLEQTREAELIQALHRARPLRRDVDVWLLTNIPLPNLPTHLVSLHELFGAPEGVDLYRWPQVEALAEARFAAVGRVTTQDFTNELKANRATANGWMDALIRTEQWAETERVPPAKRGPWVRAIVKTFSAENCRIHQ